MTLLVKNISRLNATQLVERCLFIEERLSGNPSFPDLQPDLAQVAAKRDALQLAIILAADGGRTFVAKRERRRRELKLMLDALAGSVVSQAAEDEEKILSAGFFLRDRSRRRAEVPMPLRLRARITEQIGEAQLDWATTRGAAIYVVEHNAVSPDDTNAWKQVAETTRIRYLVSGLPSAKESWFRVRAIGTAGKGPWSDVAHTLVR